MPITEKMKSRAEAVVRSIQSSSIEPAMQEIICDNVTSSLEACNGLTQEEKIERNSESNFLCACLLGQMYVKLMNPSTTSWKDVVIRSKNQIVFIVFGICALLAFRPELSAVLDSMIATR